MPLDKELYRAAYDRFRSRHDAEQRARARLAGELTPREAWRQCVELIELCWKLCPGQSDLTRRLKLEGIARYHERIRKLDEWRRARGKAH